MTLCFFASDLHGSVSRYEKLFSVIASERPAAVFLGGDLLPSGTFSFASPEYSQEEFLYSFLAPHLSRIQQETGTASPRIFVILGNDDERICEETILGLSEEGLFEYVHDRKTAFDPYVVYGYSCVPPTPFHLKDWERYDVSRYVDPGCVSPEEGRLTAPRSEQERKYGTMQKDLERLTAADNLGNAIFLFHAPPHASNLDRIAAEGKMIDHVPVDPHVGSIAIRRLIEARQPLVTLHGHIHESTRLTGTWRDQIGRTRLFSAAHDGPELALVRFDPANPEAATRELL